VGKTATGSRRVGRVVSLDDAAVLQSVTADLRYLHRIDEPVFVDEWQRFPPLWDVVRRRVDDGAPGGSFLLAGSAVPVGATIHSGAGRIVTLRMRPMSLSERGLHRPAVSIGDLLSGSRPDIAGSSDIELPTYVEEVLASGLPGIRALPLRARDFALRGYLDRLVEREVPEQGLAVRRPEALRGWLSAYAAATATTASYNAILHAATPGESAKPAKTTTIAYRDVLDGLWLLDPVPAWIPGRNRLERLTQAPKHHLADPALAASLLNVDAGALLEPDRRTVRDGTLLGRLFESLVTLEFQSAATRHRARVHHLRTREGRHEVDLVVESRSQAVLAVEVKAGSLVDDRDVRHLLWLRDQIGDDLLDMVVVTSGPYAYRRRDGVAVVPAALLGP